MTKTLGSTKDILIIEILSNDEKGVLFKSDLGMLLVPEEGFQPGGKKNYTVGLQAVPRSFWDILKRNGKEIFFN